MRAWSASRRALLARNLAGRLSRVELPAYADGDFWLTEALETDPEVMETPGDPGP